MSLGQQEAVKFEVFLLQSSGFVLKAFLVFQNYYDEPLGRCEEGIFVPKRTLKLKFRVYDVALVTKFFFFYWWDSCKFL